MTESPPENLPAASLILFMKVFSERQLYYLAMACRGMAGRHGEITIQFKAGKPWRMELTESLLMRYLPPTDQEDDMEI